jgi:hypothetical protein
MIPVDSVDSGIAEMTRSNAEASVAIQCKFLTAAL